MKETWGVSELVNIFPREIRPTGELGSTTVANLRTISNLCPDLKKAQNVMLSVSKNPDGSYKIFTFSTSKAVLDRLKEARDMVINSCGSFWYIISDLETSFLPVILRAPPRRRASPMPQAKQTLRQFLTPALSPPRHHHPLRVKRQRLKLLGRNCYCPSEGLL